MKSVILAALMAIGTTQAASIPKSKSDYCSSQKSVKRHQRILEEVDMRMARRNYGGLVGGGVCWWHSRFQRNAAYLTIYRPDKARPSERKLKRLVKDIRKGRKVIEIPGYSNFKEFSRDNYEEIQKNLESWQRIDGMVFQHWVIGLAGSPIRTPEAMKKEMDDLYAQTQQGDVVYQKLQIKGITAHAWLVIGMEKTTNGYDLFVVDSNYPNSTQKYTYEEGDDSFYYYGYGAFSPYTGKNSELNRIKEIASDYCN